MKLRKGSWSMNGVLGVDALGHSRWNGLIVEKLELDVLVFRFGTAGKTIAMEQSPAMYGGTCTNIEYVLTQGLLTLSAEGKN